MSVGVITVSHSRPLVGEGLQLVVADREEHIEVGDRIGVATPERAREPHRPHAARRR